jgi:hypothetical protein
MRIAAVGVKRPQPGVEDCFYSPKAQGWLSRSGFLTFTCEEDEEDYNYDGDQRDAIEQDRVAMVRDEREHMSPITCSEVGQNRVSDDPACRQRGQEFEHGIAHGSRSHKNGNQGRGGREQRGDCDCAKPPPAEDLVTFLHLPARNLASQRLLSAFAGEAVCNVRTCHRTKGGHQGIIKPEIDIARSQNDGEYIHGPGNGNDGAIEESQGNKAQATEMEDPAPGASGHGGRHGRNYFVVEHFRDSFSHKGCADF